MGGWVGGLLGTVGGQLIERSGRTQLFEVCKHAVSTL